MGIAFNSLRTDKNINISNEISFLNAHELDNDFSDSYHKASISDTVVVMHSNLGLELLSHCNKVVFSR